MSTALHTQAGFSLTSIPDAMRHMMRWPVAASLMERWFKAPAYTLSKAQKTGDAYTPPMYVDESSISMRWAIRFARVQLACTVLEREWNSPNGLQRLRDLIHKQETLEGIQRAYAGGAFDKPQWRFGDLSQKGSVLDKTCQVNVREVGQYIGDPLDEFYGAMGRAILKLAVSGEVSYTPQGKYQILIDQLGFYLRDSYDFNDDGAWISQPLGYWGPLGVSMTPQVRWDIPIDPYSISDSQYDVHKKYAVQNDDFADYRKKYQKGGDFLIYSDVLIKKLAQPVKVVL